MYNASGQVLVGNGEALNICNDYFGLASWYGA
jgi:hypothetical protein